MHKTRKINAGSDGNTPGRGNEGAAPFRFYKRGVGISARQWQKYVQKTASFKLLQFLINYFFLYLVWAIYFYLIGFIFAYSKTLFIEIKMSNILWKSLNNMFRVLKTNTIKISLFCTTIFMYPNNSGVLTYYFIVTYYTLKNFSKVIRSRWKRSIRNL